MNDHQINGNDANLPVENPEEFQILVDFPNAPPPIANPGDTGNADVGNPDVADSDVDFGILDTITGSGSSVAERAAERMENRSKSAIAAAMSTIHEMAMQTDMMRKGIPGGSQPRMIKIKFGVNLDFEAGALLARSGVGATMEIELEWARRSDDVLRVLRAETDVESALFTDSDNAAE